MEDLLEGLANASDDRTRVAVVRELATRKDPAIWIALITALQDPSDQVRISAASALGLSKEPRAAEALWAAIQNSRQSQAVRLSAATALAHLHDPRAVGPLVEALVYARGEASAALIELGPPAVPPLINALRTASIRQNASRALVDIGGPAVGPLIEMLRNDESRSARLAAASTLADMDDPRGNEALTDVLKTRDPEVVLSAYRFLIRRGEAGTEKQLIDLLKTYGKLEMAVDFTTSGNATLKAAAEDWARKKNYPAPVRTSDVPEVYWAGMDPKVKQLGLYHFDGSLTSRTSTVPVESKATSFVSGKWGSALSVDRGGTLKYPVPGNLDFRDGTIEMWISPRLDGTDPIYAKYHHVLLLYYSPTGNQFLVSESMSGGFFAGSIVKGQFKGAGGGSINAWKAGSWHHIAFTYSSRTSRQRFYIDGTLTMEVNGEMPAPDMGASNFTVGCDLYGNWTAFVLDELQISSGERSQDAIRNSARRKDPFPDR